MIVSEKGHDSKLIYKYKVCKLVTTNEMNYSHYFFANTVQVEDMRPKMHV